MEEENGGGKLDLYSLLKPERIVTDTYEESYENYRERRKMVAKVLREYEKGRIKHVSTDMMRKALGLKGTTYIKGQNGTENSKQGEEGA